MTRNFYFLFVVALMSVINAMAGADPVAATEPVELRVFEWEGYLSPFAADFERAAKENGIEVRLKFLTDDAGKPKLITSADDIFQAVRADQCDIVTPTNNYYKDSNSRLLKVLAPIDLAQVPNFADLASNLKTATYAEDGGQKYAVPLLGGGYSLAYNADRITVAPTSWQALFDPRYRGRVSVTNSQYEANVFVAAILSGTAPAKVYDWDSIDQAKVGVLLTQLARNTRAYWDSNPDIDLMATDLDLIADYGFGVAFANQKGQHWRFAQPLEPTTVWLDNISLTPAAVAQPAKAKAAHFLINFMISPPIQARLAELYGVVVPNPKVLDAVAAERRAAIRVGTNDFYRSDLFWQPLDKRTRNGFKSLWNNAVEAAKTPGP